MFGAAQLRAITGLPALPDIVVLKGFQAISGWRCRGAVFSLRESLVGWISPGNKGGSNGLPIAFSTRWFAVIPIYINNKLTIVPVKWTSRSVALRLGQWPSSLPATRG